MIIKAKDLKQMMENLAKDWVFHAEAVRLLGRTKQMLTKLVHSGKIERIGEPRNYLYKKQDILDYVEERKA